MGGGVVLFELNEVPWRVLDDFCASVPDSAIAKLIAQSNCYTTLAADAGHLSPWTTWPTLHRGVNDERHMIASFGQDRRAADEKYPPVWDLLKRASISVGLCGTLHSFPPPADMKEYAFYMPDALASTPDAHPVELTAFQKFNLKMSRESARNVSTRIAWGDAGRVVIHSPSLGIRPKTYKAVATQLLYERRDPTKRNRRRTLQSVMTADVYVKQLRATTPQFSSFFTNHVASAMHRYWAAAYPGDYDVKPRR